MKRYGLGVALVALVALLFLAAQSFSGPSEVPDIEATVLATHPHDDKAFTQGLIYVDGKLYESTGRAGQSSVRIVEIETGEPKKMTELDPELFGEGIVIWNDRLIQLTWQDEKVLEFDPKTLELNRTRELKGEGWGLTHDGKHLILSDGSSTLRFLDPETFEVDRLLDVTMDGRRLRDLNELEYANNAIYANVWHEDYVVKISPSSGEVVARIDLGKLIPREDRADDAVLNGIAYDPDTDRWFVTGKLWPKLFEVRFEE